MPTTLEQRPRFHDGQCLRAEDLTAVVAYARAGEARHLLGAHTWGIAAGLQLHEIARSDDGGLVDLYILPGYAWDGFGRTIVLQSPFHIDPALFEGSSNRAGLVDIWIQHEEKVDRLSAQACGGCSAEEPAARVGESFRLVVGHAIEHFDRVRVAGQFVESTSAQSRFARELGTIPDRSVPYQTFPTDGESPRWLIPLGRVRWQPGASAEEPGRFVARTHDDLADSQSRRVVIGTVTGAILAAEGSIVLADRTRDHDSDHQFGRELVRIKGAVRAEGDIRLPGTRVTFLDKTGDSSHLIALSRSDGPEQGTSLLAVQLGDSANSTGESRFGVGPLNTKTGKIDARFTVADNGRVDMTNELSVGGNLNVAMNAIKPGGGSWGTQSDIALKANIRPLNDALSLLLDLRGVRFEWKDTNGVPGLSGPQTGLIAQEVETVFPGWVSTGADGLKELTIRGFEALTVEAFRDLQNQVNALSAQVRELQEKLRQQ